MASCRALDEREAGTAGALGYDDAEEEVTQVFSPPGGAEGDEDEAAAFVEPFSLLESVVRERFALAKDSGPLVAEVIRYRAGEILDLVRADPGKSVRVAHDSFELLQMGRGAARLFFDSRCRGRLVRRGRTRRLRRLLRPETIVDIDRGTHAIDLHPGDYAQVVRQDAGYLVRFVRPPAVPRARLGGGFRLRLRTLQLVAGSAAFHLTLLVLLGFAVPAADLPTVPEVEPRAPVTYRDLGLEPPQPQPKQQAVTDAPQPPKQLDQPTPRTKKAGRSGRRPRARGGRAKAPRAGGRLLAALAGHRTTSIGRSDLSRLTNLAAVPTPAGTTGQYKVAGLIDKAGGRVALAGGGGGGGRETVSGRRLLRGSSAGRMVAAAGTGRRVVGRVARLPRRAIRTRGGHLSRAAIQRVVSRHLGAIQACYERQLLIDPGLSGKVIFDWVITAAGRVGTARQAQSSLRSAAVASCVLRQIRCMRFPRPVGGSVQVRYPFLFRARSF